MNLVTRISQQYQEWTDRQPQLLTRLGIILAVLLVSVYTGYRLVKVSSYPQILRDPVVLLAGAAILFLTLLANPRWGIYFFLPSLMLVKIDLGTGTGTNISLSIIFMLAMVGMWVLNMIVVQKEISLFNSQMLFPMFAFLGSSIVAFGFGQLPWFNYWRHATMAAQIGQVAIYFISFIVFLWVGHHISSLDLLKKITNIFFLSSIIGVISEYSGPWSGIISRIVPVSALGGVFWVWLVALAFSQLAINHQLSRFWKITLSGILLITFYFALVINRGWASGWIPPLVAVGIIIWFAFPATRRWIIVGAAVGGIFFSAKIISYVMIGDNQYSLSTRLAAWQIIAQIVKVNPLFGVGPANYYWYTPLFPIMGYRVVFNSHNNYVDLIAELGIVGLSCFLWFGVTVVRVCLRLLPKLKDDYSRAFVYAILGGWVATMISGLLGDWVLPFVYNIGYAGTRASLVGWFFLGALLYFEKMVHDQEQKAENEKAA